MAAVADVTAFLLAAAPSRANTGERALGFTIFLDPLDASAAVPVAFTDTRRNAFIIAVGFTVFAVGFAVI